ncbi:MAG: hypothetical protein JWQ74_120 [Marmoricola sp.]|nr:hypothetical protein [Marmoricola sp.]
MTGNEDLPVADDDFPEFAAPPEHKPRADRPRTKPPEDSGDAQAKADDVIARLRRERAERTGADEDA